MTVAVKLGTASIISRVPTDLSRVVVDMGALQVLSRTPMDAVDVVPWWNEDPASWEAVYLAGRRLPGLSWIDGTMGIRVSRKKVTGVHGHVPVQFGYEAGKFQVKMVLWTKEHLQDWAEQLQTLRPRPGRGQPDSVTISHPATTLMGVDYVDVIHVSLLSQDEPGMDVYNCTLDLLEHIPQPVAGKGVTQVPSLSNVKRALNPGKPAQLPTTPQAKAALPPSQTNAGAK